MNTPSSAPRLRSHELSSVSFPGRGLLLAPSLAIVLAGALAALRATAQTSDGDLIDPGSNSGYSSDAVTPVSPSNGNVTRKIVDLKIPNSPDGLLTWTRYSTTRPRRSWAQGPRSSWANEVFAPLGTWSHNWQYELRTLPPANGKPALLTLTYPSGVRREFTANDAGGWTGMPGAFETVAVTPDGFEVTTPTGARLHFVGNPAGGGTAEYKLRQASDPYGATIRLDYDQSGLLKQINDSAGNFIQLSYVSVPLQTVVRVNLGKVAATAGWQEIDVPSGLQSQVFQRVRIHPSGAHAAVNLSAALFYAPGSSQPLTGQPTGPNPIPVGGRKPVNTVTCAFTGVQYARNWGGLSLDATGGSPIGRVEVLLAPGSAGTLASLSIEGRYTQPVTIRLLAQAKASTGETVAYNYSVKNQPAPNPNPADLPPQTVVLMAGADYADGTSAHYRYREQFSGSRFSLVKADDPRFAGNTRQVTLKYRVDASRPGVTVKQVTDAVTNQTVGAVDVDESDSLKRIVHLPSGGQRVYELVPHGHGRLASVTDEAGRATTYTYDAAGRLQTQTDATGVTTFTYDNQNRVATVQRGQDSASQILRDAQGRVAQVTDAKGGVTSYTRDENGRILSTQYPDGTQQKFAYDTLGRPTLVVQRDGSSLEYTYDAQGNPTERIVAAPPAVSPVPATP